MSARVLTQGGGAGGLSASIFVAGLSEADLVNAKKESMVIDGVWGKKLMPVVFDGHTQIESIELTGTQYIDTGFVPNQNSAIEINVLFPTVENNKAFVYGAAQDSTSNAFECYVWSGAFTFNYGGQGNRINSLGTAVANKKVCITQNKNTASVQYDGGEVVSATTGTTSFTAPNSLTLGALHRTSGVSPTPLVIYACKIYDNDTLVRDYIPARRNSDGELGLYDKVNKEFYANAGTGTFIAGSGVFELVDGHLIAPINSYGMWTVTATDGIKTARQNVLVDAAVDFAIRLDYAS